MKFNLAAIIMSSILLGVFFGTVGMHVVHLTQAASPNGLTISNAPVNTQSVTVKPETISDKLKEIADTQGRDFVTVSEYSRIVGIHYDTAIERIKRGELVANKEAGQWQIPLAEILQETGNPDFDN